MEHRILCLQVLRTHTTTSCLKKLVQSGVFVVLRNWISEYCEKIERGDRNCTGHILTVICEMLKSCFATDVIPAKEYSLDRAVNRVSKLTSDEHDISTLIETVDDLKVIWREAWRRKKQSRPPPTPTASASGTSAGPARQQYLDSQASPDRTGKNPPPPPCPSEHTGGGGLLSMKMFAMDLGGGGALMALRARR